MRCSFAADDAAELWKHYDAAFPTKEDGTRKRPLSFFLGMEGNLKKYFGIKVSSLEKLEEEFVATALSAQEGKKIVHSLLRVDFVDAQRNIDDENAARSNRLSDAFATYYRRNLEQAELAEEAIAIIEQNNENLTRHYDERFRPLMTMIGGLGLPSDNDRAVTPNSSTSMPAPAMSYPRPITDWVSRTWCSWPFRSIIFIGNGSRPKTTVRCAR